jgi:hypothetical protein
LIPYNVDADADNAFDVVPDGFVSNDETDARFAS